jgi:putative hydrolase of the HAD superfamily
MATEALEGERVLIEEAAPEPSTAAQVVGEIVGSFILAVLGLGIGAAAFSAANQGAVEDVTWFSDIWPTSFGWALCIALGIYCTATLSGAHFNPAVTIALAATGRHPWSQVPRYIASQLVGWFLGAAVVVGLWGSNIKKIAEAEGVEYGDPGSEKYGSILTTYVPNPGVFGTEQSGADLVPISIGFGAEILGTALLLLVILSLLETRHANAPASWFFPLIVGSTIGLLIMFLAPLTQACFNPARDFGPRLMLLVMGFGDVAIPGPRDGAALAVTVIGPVIGALLGAFFHDKVMRPLIPGADREPALTQPGQLAREPIHVVETTTSLLGHAPALPAALAGGNGRGTEGIDLVMLDVGGTIYDDDCFAQALLRATRELAGGRFSEQAFWDLYDEARQQQSPLREALAERFGLDAKQLSDRAESVVEYTPSALYPDVKPTLDVLATRYKLGVASQNDPTTEALRRDGLLEYFSVIATPATAGANKTDVKMWKWALDQAGVPAGRAVNVGNRLDSDIRPAQQVGLRSIWLLRGESPPAPTVEQLTEPDAIVTSFSGVPNALAGMADVRTPAGVS